MPLLDLIPPVEVLVIQFLCHVAESDESVPLSIKKSHNCHRVFLNFDLKCKSRHPINEER